MFLAVLMACHEPAAGTLRDDRAGLEERMRIPTGTSAVRWYMVADRDALGKPSGRADARVYAWLTTSENSATDLEEWLGPATPNHACWVAVDVAKFLFPASRLARAHTASTRGYPLICTAFAPERIGRDDYRGTAVSLFDDGLYVALIAH